MYFEGDTSIESQSSLAKGKHNNLPEESKGDAGRRISVLGRRNTYMFMDPEAKESLAHSRNEKIFSVEWRYSKGQAWRLGQELE